MKILVMGRNGQLARALAERSTAANFASLALDFAGRDLIDLADPRTIDAGLAAASPDVIINAAAYTAVDQAEDEPEVAMRVNADGPGHLAEYAARNGARLIHISTDYVFNGEMPTPYDEGDTVEPRSSYGRSKAAGEMRIRDALPDHTIVRTAWIYSSFGQNFVKTMLRLGRERDEITVVDDQQGNPTSAFDLADGLLTIAKCWQQGSRTGLGQTYHLAGTGDATWADFAREIFSQSEALGGPTATVRGIPSSQWPTKACRPKNSRLDCSLFCEAFGYRAPPWQESLRPVIERLLSADRSAT